MLTGFATLSFLRSQLLPQEMEQQTTWDDDLARIGRGVAGQFNLYCGRVFARETGVTHSCDGGVASIQVPRYPVEQVTALALEPSGGGSNEDILTTIATLSKAAGVIKLSTLQGTYRDRLHVTYDGGYWIDDQIESQPSGSTKLPDELLDAWVLQCQAEVEHQDLFGAGAAKPGGAADRVGILRNLDLLPRVKSILDSYRRIG